MATTERRKEMRMGLSLPVRVQGHDGQGTWEEMTTSDDASFGGASFRLRHRPLVGHVLHLSMPLPKSFRRYSMSEPSYQTYALVRAIGVGRNGARVGVMFLGKTPPRDYESNPSGRYLLPNDPKPAPKERRRFRRLDLFLNFRLRAQEGAPGPEEQTIAENVGKGGARVLTAMPRSKGEIITLEEIGGPFRTRAEIKNVYIGKDNVPRLNLQFLDGEAPDRLITAGAP